MEITDKDAFGLWKKTLDYINSDGSDYKDPDGRTCREVFNLVVTLQDAHNSNIDKPIARMSKTKNWMYPSKEELSGIIFKKFPAPIYNFTYGRRIFNFSDVKDQVNEFVLPLLRKDIYSKRAVIVFYDPVVDSDVDNRNTPSIIYAHFRVRNKKLHLTVSIRSNDIFFGWPANVYQFYFLQKTVAEELKVEVGDISVISNSAHFFVEDLEYMESILSEKSK